MDALPEFSVITPTTLDEAIAARAAHPGSKPLGGGTDLVVAEGRPQSGEPGVYLVHVATQQETRLFSYSAQVPAPELVLSPDGRTLLYSQWEMVESAVVSVNLASRKTPKR